MRYKIETGIPFPNKDKLRMPFESMIQGTSFIIPCSTESEASFMLSWVYLSLRHYPFLPKGFDIATQILDDKKTIRVWRVM